MHTGYLHLPDGNPAKRNFANHIEIRRRRCTAPESYQKITESGLETKKFGTMANIWLNRWPVNLCIDPAYGVEPVIHQIHSEFPGKIIIQEAKTASSEAKTDASTNISVVGRVQSRIRWGQGCCCVEKSHF